MSEEFDEAHKGGKWVHISELLLARYTGYFPKFPNRTLKTSPDGRQFFYPPSGDEASDVVEAALLEDEALQLLAKLDVQPRQSDLNVPVAMALIEQIVQSRFNSMDQQCPALTTLSPEDKTAVMCFEDMAFFSASELAFNIEILADAVYTLNRLVQNMTLHLGGEWVSLKPDVEITQKVKVVMSGPGGQVPEGYDVENSGSNVVRLFAKRDGPA